MNHRHTSAQRIVSRLATGLLVAITALVGFGSSASAGGWAVTTLDATPAPVPGEPVDVGFTIRQHGVTLVDLDDVAIEVTAADGTVQHFPAASLGTTGHYVATITLPDAGDYTWTVQQGWFGPQDLGALNVAGGTSAGTDHRWPAPARYGLPALAGVFGAAAIADLIVGRRRRRTVAA